MNAVKITIAVAGLMGLLCLPFACISWGGEPKPDVERIVTDDWEVDWDCMKYMLRPDWHLTTCLHWPAGNAALIGWTDPRIHRNFVAVVPWREVKRYTKVVRLP